jgi:alkylation response protein AidB-like acyl-CoA dehydrogenase
VELMLHPGYERYDAIAADLAQRLADDATLRAIWADGTIHHTALYSELAAIGWVGAAWPAAYGGHALDPAALGAMWEALNYHRLPVDLIEITEMAAWVIVTEGTDEQRATLLPRVRSGRTLISLGYTEPDAGSDVAAVRTTATRTSQGWRIDGTKVFTTGAHVCDYLLLLVRTDAARPKHAGLSMFLVPATAQGIRVDPIRTFGGERTNTVYLDGAIVGDGQLVGALNDGWAVLTQVLNFERSLMGTYVGRARRLLDDLRGTLLLRADPVPESATTVLEEFERRIEAARVLADDVYCRIARGAKFAASASMAKYAATEVLKDLAFAALDLAGPESLLARAHGRFGSLEHWFRDSQIATIYGGSSEMQLEIIATQQLGLRRGA